MGVALSLADWMGYKKIVLLGVDLQTHKHFFDDLPEAREYSALYNSAMSQGGVYESMIPKGDKYRRMDEYYYAVRELYFRPKGIELFVGNEDNVLSPRLPFYPEFAALAPEPAAHP